MKVKVCGMRDEANIRALSALRPDYMGFIFYPKSKRYVSNIESSVLEQIPEQIKKTGVFVNESVQAVLDKIRMYGLQAVQLHGDETPEVCEEIAKSGAEVIKAFGIDETVDFSLTEPYEGKADYFLFDTKTSGYGGSGRTFDWKILERYNSDTSYFLSGGLNPENIRDIALIRDERLYAADLNSGFETMPGMKNISELKKAINLLKYE